MSVATMSDQGTVYRPFKWTFGPKSNDQVPDSVDLLPKPDVHGGSLGLKTQQARSYSSDSPSLDSRASSENQDLPTIPASHEATYSRSTIESASAGATNKTGSKRNVAGNITLSETQPEQPKNESFKWKLWRRDLALLCLGLCCFVASGMSTVLAAGFSNVAQTYDIGIPKVSLSTGFYMLGLGIGDIFATPTAILYGKRPVYVGGVILLVISAIWCSLSPNYPSLVIARTFQGIALSPFEVLPSMAVGEINSHYERAYRLSLHTIVLLAGTNLMPLIGAAIIQGLGWQWVFWISAIFGAIGGVLLLLAAPETLQDRTSEPRDENNTSVMDAGPLTRCVNKFGTMEKGKACRDSRPTSQSNCTNIPELTITTADTVDKRTIAERRGLRAVGFVQEPEKVPTLNDDPMARILIDHTDSPDGNQPKSAIGEIYGARTPKTAKDFSRNLSSGCDEDDHITGRDAQQRRPSTHRDSWRIQPEGQGPQTPELHNFNSPSYLQPEFSTSHGNKQDTSLSQNTDLEAQTPATVSLYSTRKDSYTQTHLNAKPETFLKSMKPWNERISQEDWIRLSVRPFLLFAYPSIIWSSLVYALSIGWLIVLSETVTVVYSSRDSYNFSVLQCGLVYLSPFVGGILGIVVAAKSSDLIAGWMTKRNNGLYEPKFRLVMAIPILISTVIGLMGFGWAAQEKDPWILPTIFFGIISFGSSFGATTAITFAVDSYPQNTAEALVSLNFSKNILHGFIFSFFTTSWLEAAGSKTVFLIIGGIQIFGLLLTIPMFIYGKRARSATSRWSVASRLEG